MARASSQSLRYGSEAQASEPIWPSASETFDRKNKIMRAQKKIRALKRPDGKTVATLTNLTKETPGYRALGFPFSYLVVAQHERYGYSASW